MTIVFECDSRVNWRPGIHRGRAMLRVWWLWFAVAWLHVPFDEFTQIAYRWEQG